MSVWSATLGRDVLASALATGLAAFMFAPAPQREEGVPTGAFGPTGKFVERVGQDGVEPIGRALRVYETIALFGTRPAEPAPFAADGAVTTEAPLPPPAPRIAASDAHLAAEPERPSVVAVLPPPRPHGDPPAIVVASGSAPGQKGAATPRPEPVRLLGWTVPGSENLPSGRDAVGRLAWIGDRVGALGATLVDGVGLR